MHKKFIRQTIKIFQFLSYEFITNLRYKIYCMSKTVLFCFLMFLLGPNFRTENTSL